MLADSAGSGASERAAGGTSPFDAATATLDLI